MSVIISTSELTKLLRTQVKQFFHLSLYMRTTKKLSDLYDSIFPSIDTIMINCRGITITSFNKTNHFISPSSVFIYFVREQISVFTTISFAESHPFLSNSFHTLFSNEMCVYGTIWNNKSHIEHNSCITFIMDINMNAFFIDCWFPNISVSLHDVISCICQNKNGTANYACVACKYIENVL